MKVCNSHQIENNIAPTWPSQKEEKLIKQIEFSKMSGLTNMLPFFMQQVQNQCILSVYSTQEK